MPSRGGHNRGGAAGSRAPLTASAGPYGCHSTWDWSAWDTLAGFPPVRPSGKATTAASGSRALAVATGRVVKSGSRAGASSSSSRSSAVVVAATAKSAGRGARTVASTSVAKATSGVATVARGAGRSSYSATRVSESRSASNDAVIRLNIGKSNVAVEICRKSQTQTARSYSSVSKSSSVKAVCHQKTGGGGSKSSSKK